MTEIILQVLESLGWGTEDILNTPRSNSLPITAYALVSAILNTVSMPYASASLGIGEQTGNRLISKTLVPLFGKRTGGGDSWKLILLDNAGLKECHVCNQIRNKSEFTKDLHKYAELDRRCRPCKSLANAESYATNKDRYHKPYIEEHRHEYNARNAYRRAKKIVATPCWANISNIKSIYANCPEGYHVDHIYPLLSDWVCGLHVEDNLQYLSAKENMQKGNRRMGDW